MANGEWTRDELAAIGRPLQSFDVCPHCGERARLHRYNSVSGALVCPATIMVETRDEFARRIAREERDRQRDLATRKELEDKTRAQVRRDVLRERRERAATATKPIIDTTRKYFDEG